MFVKQGHQNGSAAYSPNSLDFSNAKVIFRFVSICHNNVYDILKCLVIPHDSLMFDFERIRTV